MNPYPENPSSRFPLYKILFKCSFCGAIFEEWKEFIAHMDKQRHRICYKCGMDCGGMKEYINQEYIAVREVKDNICTFKYKHIIPCPFLNPSRRWE